MRPPLRDVSLTAWSARVEHRHGLGEVDDVDVVAGAEDVIAHLRVPAVGLMAEVNASFQKLAHAVIGQRHGLLRLFRRGRVSSGLAVGGHRTAFWPRSACEMAGLI